MSASPEDAVLLLHGAWMNRWVMSYLAFALQREGFAVQTFVQATAAAVNPTLTMSSSNGWVTAAVVTVHFKNGIWNTEQGYEYNLVLVLALLVVAAADAGRYSLDHALGLALNGAAWGFGALAVGIAGGLGAVASARVAARQRSAARGRDRGRGAHPTTA